MPDVVTEALLSDGDPEMGRLAAEYLHRHGDAEALRAAAAALDAFLAQTIDEVAQEGTLFSLHLKATMMKVSDPIIFGHAVSVYYEPVFSKYADKFEALGIDPDNGVGDVYAKIAALPDAEREAIRLTGDARRQAEEELRGARTRAEFNRLMNLMLGELNASHLGHSGRTGAPQGGDGASTGKLGLRFDRVAYENDGRFVVTEVVELGPADISDEISVGDQLMSVGGVALDGSAIQIDYMANRRYFFAGHRPHHVGR